MSTIIPWQESVGTLGYTAIRSWQRDVRVLGMLPLIGVAGTRGKSTVLRMVEAMATRAHLRAATWTDLGVQIVGRRQSGELSGWSKALTQLAESRLDLALQELDWNTVNAVGLPPESYPVMVLCGLRDQTDTPERSPALQTAIRGAQQVIRASHHDGLVVVNGDDYYAVDAIADCDAHVIMISQSHNAPALRRHLDDGGSGVWIHRGHIWIGDRDHAIEVDRAAAYPITMGGEASFNVTNLLLAIAIANGIGLDLQVIKATLLTFRAAWDVLPASMNVYETPSNTAVIDQMAPGWVIKSVLRAINPHLERRQITVVGDLGWISAEDVVEFGRQLGRYHGAIVMHGEQDARRLADFKRGLATNDYPPLLIRLPTERRAINRAFKSLKPGDVLLILTTHDSSAAHRAVRRHIAAPEKS